MWPCYVSFPAAAIPNPLNAFSDFGEAGNPARWYGFQIRPMNDISDVALRRMTERDLGAADHLRELGHGSDPAASDPCLQAAIADPALG
jgi:hypothetical protein